MQNVAFSIKISYQNLSKFDVAFVRAVFYLRGSQTSPSFWNQMDHDRFSTVSALCGDVCLFAHKIAELSAMVKSLEVVPASASLTINWRKPKTLSLTRNAFGILPLTWRNANLSTSLKLRLFKSNVVSVLLYGFCS